MSSSVNARRAIAKLLDNREPWTGPVIRRDPATYQLPPIIVPWRCRNCRHWTPEGSRDAGRCLLCHAPKPPDV